MDTVQTFQNLLPRGFGMPQKSGPFALTADEKVSNRNGITRIKCRTLGYIADFRLAATLTGGGEDDDAVVLLLTQNGL